jgi:hypothetical protein
VNPSQAETPPPRHPGGTLDRALALAGFLARELPLGRRADPALAPPYLLEEAHEAAHAIAARRRPPRCATSWATCC